MTLNNIDARRRLLTHVMAIHDALINIEYMWIELDDDFAIFISETDYPFEGSLDEVRAAVGKWILTMRYEYDS